MDSAAAFDLSYRRLAPDHAELFRLLALNPGPDIGLEATTVLADRPPSAVRTMLRALVQAHLLDCVIRRWSMHDLVRDYATELLHDPRRTAEDAAKQDKMDATAACSQVRSRLLEHYSATALAASAHLTREPVSAASGAFADQATALTWLDSERANLIASVAAAAAAGDQDIATRLPVILYDYLIWRGYVDDLIAVTTIACTVAHQAGALAAEAGAWNNLGIALTEASRYDDAVTAHGRAVDLFTSLENQHERGKALNGLGSALRDSGRSAAALPIHQAALAAQKDAGDLWEQAAVLNNLSLDHQELGNVAEACAAAEQAASLFQQLGDTTCEAKALCTAAFALQAAGRSQEAHGVCERAVEAASRSAGSPRDAAAILMTCAELLTDLTPQQWIAYLLRAQAACESANAHDLHAHTLSAIGLVYIAAGDTDQAATHLTRAASMFDDFDLLTEAAEVRTLLSMLRS
ncbi:tetratricopeptide repeat protein [Streptomyces arboris]|uniref:tetratricopeptide repeat protein n=1 Tax=Streptomyces arboris TaxID=2600619 RepID=UPI003BF49422